MCGWRGQRTGQGLDSSVHWWPDQHQARGHQRTLKHSCVITSSAQHLHLSLIQNSLYENSWCFGVSDQKILFVLISLDCFQTLLLILIVERYVIVFSSGQERVSHSLPETENSPDIDQSQSSRYNWHLDAGLCLVGSDHVTWILASDRFLKHHCDANTSE